MIKYLFKEIGKRWPFPVCARTKTGRRMYVDLRSGIGRGIYVVGEFDAAVFPPISANLAVGSTFIDIGANVGYYSMLALDIVGATGQVHAFEIDPRPLKCLAMTKRQFKLDNFHIHPVALGSSDGHVLITKDSECGNRHVAITGNGISVPMTSLDAWFAMQNLGRIDVLKIDVEGFELEVLRGGLGVIERFRPHLVIEADDNMLARNRASVALIKALLHPYGYAFNEVKDCWSPTLYAVAKRLTRVSSH